MATFSNIDGEESATVTFRVAAVALDRGGTVELQEILVLGDPESTASIARVSSLAPKSTDAALAVRIAGGPSSVADLSVRPIAPSTYGDGGLYRVAQSSAGDLNVTVAGYSTTVNISSLAGPVIVRSSKADALGTVYQSSAADLNVTVAGYSTIAAVSSVGGIVAITPASSGATGFFATRMGDGSTFITDSTDRSLRVSVVAGTISVSTTVNISSLAGPVICRSSKADFLANVYQSTAADLNVTVAGYSTTVNISSLAGPVVVRSSAADALGTVYQSSYGALLANVHNSTIGDLLASVQQNSTVWQVQAKIQDSSAVGFVGSVTRPTTDAQGLLTRTILNDIQSTCFSTQGNNSTSNTVVSSVAAQRVKVFAYSVTSTVQAVNTLSFASSLANPIWQIQMQSVSSGISGANLAVTPPAWLFATAASEPLVFKVTGTTGSYHLSFSYFIEA